MLTYCSSTPESIAEVLLAGDLILNLSASELNVGCGVRVLTTNGTELMVADDADTRSCWNEHLADLLIAFGKRCSDRVVVVVDEAFDHIDEITSVLNHSGLTFQICLLQSSCDAEAFMDEADSEAVAERLRQLGYI